MSLMRRADLRKDLGQIEIPKNVKKKNIPVTKITKRGISKPYFFKQYDRGASEFSPIISAVGAHFQRLVIDPAFAPKTRVVNGKKASISKTVDGYQSHLERNQINKLTPEELAKISAKILCFEDPDCHDDNHGRSCDGYICSPDDDRLFGAFSNQYQDFNNQVYANEHDLKKILIWNNLIYSLDDAFSVISSDDFFSAPFFVDLKPYNHPFKKENDVNFIGRLKKNKKSECDDALFFILTKYFLLLDDERIKMIIRDHVVSESKKALEFSESFFNTVSMHRDKLFSVFVSMPEYHEFIENKLSNYTDKMYKQILDYQDEFCNERRIPKAEKEHHIVYTNRVQFNTDIQKLSEIIHKLKIKSKPEYRKKLYIDLLIARLKRDVNAVLNFHIIRGNEEKKIKDLVDFARKHDLLDKKIGLEQRRDGLFESYLQDNDFCKIYFLLQKSKRSETFEHCINEIIADRKKLEKPIKDLENSVTENVIKHVTSLFDLLDSDIMSFPQEQLTAIAHALLKWDDSKHILRFFHILLQANAFEKIPETLWRYLAVDCKISDIETHINELTQHRTATFQSMYQLLMHMRYLFSLESDRPTELGNVHNATKIANYFFSMLIHNQHEITFNDSVQQRHSARALAGILELPILTYLKSAIQIMTSDSETKFKIRFEKLAGIMSPLLSGKKPGSPSLFKVHIDPAASTERARRYEL